MKKTLLVSALLAVFMVTLTVSTVHATSTSPQSFLLELEETVQSAPDQRFRGYTFTYTKQLKDALTHKINAVIQLIDAGKHQAAYNKLHNDIAQKLTICDTNRVRARSWLSYTHPVPEEVEAFSEVCLDLIDRASFILTQGS
jgi:hypothetical protein